MGAVGGNYNANFGATVPPDRGGTDPFDVPTVIGGGRAGRNLIKVNGRAVLQAVEIKNYDVISIGTTKLIFVGLCGQQFSWEKRELGNG